MSNIVTKTRRESLKEKKAQFQEGIATLQTKTKHGTNQEYVKAPNVIHDDALNITVYFEYNKESIRVYCKEWNPIYEGITVHVHGGGENNNPLIHNVLLTSKCTEHTLVLPVFTHYHAKIVMGHLQ
jgi:hypothetical protein